jgi:glycosyltransferase involved in cell wall biosynthesis
LPGLCQFISKNLIERFEAAGKKFNIFYYGETVGEYQYGKNLGQLNKSQLFELYKKCDFGMVASYTNISLVPYEMMATGLPIIEFVDGSFQYFFDKDDAFLFDFDYDQLFYEIQEAIENPIILVERNEKIQQKLSMLSWGNTAKEFEKILKKLIQQ